jgi:hypothetical protein
VQRVQALRVCVMICSFLAIVVDLLVHVFRAPLFWFLLLGIALGWLFAILYYAEELCFDIDRNVYTYERGFLLDFVFLSGNLTDIDHIHLGQEIDKDGKVVYVSWLVFRPEFRRDVLYFRGLHYPLTEEIFEAQINCLLETATRLNVPLHDESGWRGTWRTPATKPELYIIPPGEPHPSSLLPPPAKW